MKTTYSRTTAPKSRIAIVAARYLGILAILAAMLTAPASARPIPINIRLADPYHGCQPRLGLCITSFDVAAGTPSTAVLMDVKREIDKGPRGVATLRFVSQIPDGDSLPIADDIVLDRATSLRLGYPNVTLKRGMYMVNRSAGQFGEVVIDAEMMGITIDINVGRASRNCAGFGICSIVISADLASANLGAAVLEGNTLSVDLLDDAASNETSITIDEDIVLDEATSLALGAKRVKILAGTYDIDRSTNPNGEVDLPVERFGITVNIRVGQRSFGCAGFGICDIDIIFNLAAANPAVLSTDGNMMTIDYLTKQSGNTLRLDEDVVIEGPVALDFTYQKIVMKAGVYDIDFSSNPNGTVNVPMNRFGITIYIETGRRSKGCTGFGICSITIDLDLRNAAASLNGNTLSVDFLSMFASTDGSDSMVIDEDIVLDAATSRALGAKSVTVRKGTYFVDRRTNPNGHADISVSRLGVTISIEVGRRSRGCTGFGVCSITIDIDLRTAGMTPAVASLDGKNLEISFLERPTSAGEQLVLENDVVLDAKTARALGHQGVVLPAGSYTVDYSTNPNGTVVIPVKPEGVTLTIYIGRSWGNCRGFGICNITLEDRFFDRMVPASATVKGSTMSLDLLGAAPEKGDMLTIDEDIVLDGKTALALGYRTVRILAGSYPVSYDENENGHVDLDVKTVGITIIIELGRSSRNCTSFGICSITTELRSVMNRPETAVVVAGSNNLASFSFAAPTVEEGDSLYIDQDLELTGDDARAFGKDEVTIKAGAYYVDRSENEYGTVVLATSDDGTASVENVTSTKTAMTVMPNPASSAAMVGFNVDGMQNVTLTLLDARGQVVKVLIGGERLSSGRHERVVNLTDLPAGAYFQRLSVGSTNTITPLQIVR